MRMSTDDGFYGEFVAAEQMHDAMNFVAGIKLQCLARDGISNDGAIALQQAHRHCEVKKVLRGLWIPGRRGVRHTRQYNIRPHIDRVVWRSIGVILINESV